jgi:uncharacterized protein (TIGR02117 family)
VRPFPRKLLIATGAVLAIPLAAASLYFAAAFVMVLFPASPQQAETADPAKTVEAYVIAYAAHTDLVLPVSSAIIDWRAQFPLSDFMQIPPDAEFIAVGWGDREFYLNTPEWKDLTVSRAVGAMLGVHGTLLHVTYLRKIDFADYARPVPLSAGQYAALVRYILDSAPQRDHKMIAVPNIHYGSRDAFYEAHGSYNMFKTCNAWTGEGLLRAGVKVSRWTPLATLVVWHLPPAPPP